jgi:DNA-binding XRE family transcriptional regulator/predicted GIY-YIG superfamily endonuclease
MFYVYRIYDDRNKNYIGVTEFPDKRIVTHMSKNGSKPIAKAIDEGIKFDYEILFSFNTAKEAYEKEKELIIQYDSISSGYNITPGGFGGFKDNRRGELNTQAILTEDLVISIRETYAIGNITQEELAKKYGVSRENISAIVRGKSWPEVGGPTGKRKPAIKKAITEEIKNQIISLRKEKTSYNKIAEKLGITIYYAHKFGKGVS